jgi:chorismate lyase/3-hydroxybenzoate synthase
MGRNPTLQLTVLLSMRSVNLLGNPSSTPFRVGFGNGSVASDSLLQIATPRLGGVQTEEIFGDAISLGLSEGVRLFRSGDFLLGHAQAPFIPSELSARTETLYRRIFAATQGQHLYRIWNYVPEINAHTAGKEHYRTFCEGRSLAFESCLGHTFEPQLPAASAVGCAGPTLEVVFAAGLIPPTHLENPEQTPAYHYPPEHGPRAPSFARATVVSTSGRTFTFISGTSAIKGHQTIAPGELPVQIDCTIENLRLMSKAAGLGDDLVANGLVARHFKVYLRHAADFAATKTHLERTLLQPSDAVIYLQADICRAALNVEVEATIVH